jgi:signal transduction histidine kinase
MTTSISRFATKESGAPLGNGLGLIGLKDRAEALGVRMTITSPAGSGTLLHVTIPLDSE